MEKISIEKNKKILMRFLFSLPFLKKYTINKLYTINEKKFNKAFQTAKIDNKKIIFSSYLGKSYSCNPRFIYENILNDDRFREYTFIWVFKKNVIDKGIVDKNKGLQDPRTKIVSYNSKDYFKELTSAKFWIFNSKLPSYIKKGDKQKYLQTWHGTPLKRLGLDIEVDSETKFYRSGMSYEEMVETYLIEESRFDYLLSPSKYATEKLKSAFNTTQNKILELGYPRNDILFNSNEEMINDLRKFYNVPINKKVILYAPTWRDDNFSAEGYKLQLEVDFKKWEKVLGNRYVILFKPHYLIVHNIIFDNQDFVKDATSCQDISDLYLISDILVTDYSSVFFDYGPLKRPILFYMYDLDKYMNNLRGFYLNIYEDLPGPIVNNEDELLKLLNDIESVKNQYLVKYEKFIELFCNQDDGNAANRVVERFFNFNCE